jgi:23S rRNA (uracil1939-C5)-methyltransferase
LWKTAIFRETLRRIGKITWEKEIAVHSAFPWNYRNQAQLKISRGGDQKIELGFFANESHRLVKIDACRLLSPTLNKTLADLLALPELSLAPGIARVDLMADDRDCFVMLMLCGSIDVGQGERLARTIISRLPQVKTAAFEFDGKTRAIGESHLYYEVGAFKYQVSPGSFFQGCRFLLPELVRSVVGQERGPSEPSDRADKSQDETEEPVPAWAARYGPSCALDLYAGVGLFTLPLARRFDQVIAVESHPGCTADLTANARAYSMENVRPVNQTVFDFLRRFPFSAPDLVVLDPPRAGVRFPTLKLLTRFRPVWLCYVSCYPPTLARDLAVLTQHGYKMASVDLFDSFPQTSHIESVAWLKRTGEGHQGNSVPYKGVD